MSEQNQMKPMIIIPPGLMTEADIKELRNNGVCVVQAKDPKEVKFLDPIPSAGNRDKIEMAAIKMSQVLLNGQWKQYWNDDRVAQQGFSHIYVKCLLEGTSLDQNGSEQEQRQKIYDASYRSEIADLARADAKEERKRLKEPKLAAAKVEVKK